MNMMFDATFLLELSVMFQPWFGPELESSVIMFVTAVGVVVVASVFMICKTLIDIFTETRKYHKI